MSRRIYTKPQSEMPTPEPEIDLSVAETDLDSLVARSQEILRREITNLMIESSSKKLSPTSSAALVQYVKLLYELKEKEDEELKNKSDEFLQGLADAKSKKGG